MQGSLVPWQSPHILKEWCHFIYLCHYHSTSSKSKLQLQVCAISFSHSHVFGQYHKMFHSRLERCKMRAACRVLSESHSQEWKRKKEAPGPAHTVRWCLMKTFGHCWTLVSGQAVDTCCQELNGTPPSSRDRRSEGQLHQYSPLTSLLDPWKTLCLLCTLAIRVKVLSSPAYIMFTGRQTTARETGSETSSTDCSLDCSQWWWASAGLARLKLAFSLKLQGTRLKLDFIAGKWMGRVPAVACR